MAQHACSCWNKLHGGGHELAQGAGVKSGIQGTPSARVQKVQNLNFAKDGELHYASHRPNVNNSGDSRQNPVVRLGGNPADNKGTAKVSGVAELQRGPIEGHSSEQKWPQI